MRLPPLLTCLATLLFLFSSSSAAKHTHHPRAAMTGVHVPPPKYFTEAGDSLILGHYDGRFYRGELLYDDHRRVLRDLIRSYLATMRAAGIDTWLAHGTLLGWWWNGQILPWDFDIDVQVTMDTMTWLAGHRNGTQYVYGRGEDGVGEQQLKLDDVDLSHGGESKADEDGTRRYLLDVNPYYNSTDLNDLSNVIDARWIDTANGMFVDITAVAERRPDDRPSIWSDKNYHRYRTVELWPMRSTQFENVPARIPYSFQKVLSDEYGTRSLVLEEWEGHRWDAGIKQWVKMGDDEERARKLEILNRKKKLMQEQAGRTEEGS